MITALLVLGGGGLGAAVRFVVDAFVQSRRRDELPLGTLVVNLSGCLLLGLLVGVHASHRTLLLLGTAILGSYTTFSTWILETHRAGEGGRPGLAWGNVAISVAGGLGAAALGRALGGAL